MKRTGGSMGVRRVGIGTEPLVPSGMVGGKEAKARSHADMGAAGPGAADNPSHGFSGTDAWAAHEPALAPP